MVSFSNEELAAIPKAVEGVAFMCPKCGELHALPSGETMTPRKDTQLVFYLCGNSVYIAAVAGKLIV